MYGLGANALDPQACQRIFTAKGRPLSDPLIVHIAGEPATALTMLVDTGVIVPVAADRLATVQALIDAFWPGPLTLLLPRGRAISAMITAGRDNVAIRMPSHPLARALIALAAVPIAAPSANRFGHTSPTTAAHVQDDLAGRVDLILDGGSTTIGVESTVLDVLGPTPRILRHGGVTREQIEAVLYVSVVDAPKTSSATLALEAPGMLERHYAPDAPLRIAPDIATLQHWYVTAGTDGKRVGLLLTTEQARKIRVNADAQQFILGDDLVAIARNLYVGLRALDAAGVDEMLIMAVPRAGLGAAIGDRLARAAHTLR